MAAAAPRETKKAIEGILAINKPQWASSAGVLRDLQTHFSTSPLFTPWLDYTRRNMILGGARARHIRNLDVKIGHGGTLDPLATGVLIVGIGKGTKLLGRFLECTKSYECVVVFGAATDSYDVTGKVVSRAEYAHVTKELVESKLEQFRGKIMQKPSIFSALKVNGKPMYQYARDGGDVPEVAARAVEVESLELVEWLEPGTHEYSFPKEELDSTEMAGAERFMGIRKEDLERWQGRKEDQERWQSRKRSRTPDTKESDAKKAKTEVETSAVEVDDHVTNSQGHPRSPQTDDEPAMSGALPVEDATMPEKPASPVTAADTEAKPVDLEAESVDAEAKPAEANSASAESLPPPPAARLRMTVTSGFYVRSLCHDLGIACSSLGFMTSLIRTRQGDYTLGNNVLEYSDLQAGPQVWEPRVKQLLEESMEKEGWVPEEVEDEETWLEKKKELEKRRAEGDRDRSYQGGGRGKGGGGGGGGKWKGKGGYKR